MIQQLTTAQAQQYVVDDPVRGHLSAEYRTTDGRQMWALYEDRYAAYDDPSDQALAIICVAYTNCVPTNETELHWYSTASGTGAVDTDTAVFYTVWSYSQGAGQTIVNRVAEHIRLTRPEVARWVTLSPLTEMAERFHLKNGARFVDRYATAQTFEYTHLLFV
jgi:DICT domain-containing protein